MGQVSGIRFALTGATLIAISFGLARFAFGLFVPQIRADLEISANTIGVIAALPLISVVFISLVAPLVTKYFGARNTTVLSALFGVFGLALVSQLSSTMVAFIKVVLICLRHGLYSLSLLDVWAGLSHQFGLSVVSAKWLAMVSPRYSRFGWCYCQ